MLSTICTGLRRPSCSHPFQLGPNLLVGCLVGGVEGGNGGEGV